MNKINYRLKFAWAILGVSLILGGAIIRVYTFAIPTLEYNFSTPEWVTLTSWSIFMLVTEGYYGFQKKFSPRVVARAQYVALKGNMVDVLLAPLFCMGFFRTTRRRLLSAYILTATIVLFVIAVSNFPQPWRGIVDWGVLLGLSYGLVWIIIYAYRAIKLPENAYVATHEVI